MAKKVNYTKELFFIYALYFFSLVLFDSTTLILHGDLIELISTGLKGLVIFFLLILVGIKGLNVKEWLLFFLLLSLFLISSYFSKTTFLVFFLLFLFASKEINFQEFLSYDFYLRIFMILFVILLNRIGFLEDTVLVRYGSIERHSLGFTSPNTLSVLVFGVILDYFLIKWNKVNIFDFVFSFLITIGLYKITGSRTAGLLLIASLVTFFFLNYSSVFKNRIVQFFILITPIILTIFSFLMITKIRIGSNLFTMINKFTSSRLYYYDQTYDLYGSSLLGQDIPSLSENFAKKNRVTQLNLDSSYLSLGIRYGVIMLVIFVLLLMVILKKQISNGFLNVMLATFLICIYGFTENIIFKPELSVVCVMGSFLLNSIIFKSDSSE